MFQRILSKIFGTRNDRMLASLQPTLKAVNAFADELIKLTDEQLQQETGKFKQQLSDGSTLEDILPRAFAVAREASTRVLGKRHYDVQILGAIALNNGNVSEAKTGEGKTLMAVLPAYLNALANKYVHIIVPNDYLASRDSETMGAIYTFLGLTVAYTTDRMPFEEKQLAYQSNIVYSTNNCVGFDYLRDNMRIDDHQKLIPSLDFCIIDEVDSILIDDARTPLILTGASETSSELYQQMYAFIKVLSFKANAENNDVDIDKKDRLVHLTDIGSDKLQALLVKSNLILADTDLFDLENTRICHYVNACLQARFLFQKDIEYIVDNGQVVIINTGTGRKSIGKRWGNGIHQALEAKENVEIQRETQTVASITYQNLFRLYDKLSGMTGTADTEATELKDIYGLDVLVIPPNKPCIRVDQEDTVYNTLEEKTKAIIREVVKHHRGEEQKTETSIDLEDNLEIRQGKVEKIISPVYQKISYLYGKLFRTATLKHGNDAPDEKMDTDIEPIKQNIDAQPILIGTISIEYSEVLSKHLTKEGIEHSVLNAKQHEQEASIIENAGCLNSVTIATNMAGRGTDIILGGNPNKVKDWEEKHKAVVEAGGLHVIGTERHECQRIDNQLIGRSGRQGDPGSSQFYLSFDDQMMRFVPKAVREFLIKLTKDGEPISDPSLTKSINNAQRTLENRYYDMRKEVIKMDDVANHQRQIIYAQRNELLSTEDISEIVASMVQYTANFTTSLYLSSEDIHDWNLKGLEQHLVEKYRLSVDLSEIKTYDQICTHIATLLLNLIEAKKHMVSEKQFKLIEKRSLLMVLDKAWKEQLSSMDHLRQGINFRSLAQKNPVHEFKQDSFVLFEKMLQSIKLNTVAFLITLTVTQEKKSDRKISGGYTINTKTHKTAPAAKGYKINMIKNKKENHETV
jgi:preprotein translocase subunit SecA